MTANKRSQPRSAIIGNPAGINSAELVYNGQSIRQKQIREMKNPDNPSNASSRTSTYPLSRMAPSFDLLDLARQIADGDKMLNVKVSSKLHVIADQIKALQTEAEQILKKAQQDQALNQAECNFKRIPGTIYHLYQRPGGKELWSMLSPEDWNGNPPQLYRGSYFFEADHSWTPVEALSTQDDTRETIRQLMKSIEHARADES